MQPISISSPQSSHIDYRLVALASVLLSLWLIALDPVINRDAILYLRTAEVFLQDGFIASQQQFGRPLLPIIIAIIHWGTGLPLLYAGLLVTTLSYILLSVSFVATVHTLGGDKRIQWIAALLILSHPMFNQNRSAIMRDPAYWALIMLAMREMLLYIRRPVYRHTLRWLACIATATLFRFEGLFFAIFAPFCLLCVGSPGSRLRHTCTFLLPILVVSAASAGLSAIVLSGAEVEGRRIFPAIERYIEGLLALPENFKQLAGGSAEVLLEYTARADASVAVLAAFAAIVLINLIRALTWPYLAVLLWAWWVKLWQRIKPGDSAIIVAHMLIGLLYLGLFMLINQFVLERYAKQVVIFALLYLPFAIHALLQKQGRRGVRSLTIVLLLFMCLDTLHTGEYKKAFIRDATDWVVANTPERASVASNEKYIGYFSRRRFDWAAATRQNYQLENLIAGDGNWRDVDYLVVVVKRGQQARWAQFLEKNALVEQATFESDERAKASVVQIHPLRSTPQAPTGEAGN